MKPITRVYQLCGFDLVEKNFSTIFRAPKKFSVLFVFLLHFIYICLNLRYQYNFQAELFKHPDIVGNTTNLVEMVAPILCHITIILESLCKRKKEEKIRNLMRKLNCNLHANVTSFPLVKFLFLVVVNSLICFTAFILTYHVVGKLFRYK